jgi:hypothetical protein
LATVNDPVPLASSSKNAPLIETFFINISARCGSPRLLWKKNAACSTNHSSGNAMMRDFHDDDGNGGNHKGRRHKGESREIAPTPICVI